MQTKRLSLTSELMGIDAAKRFCDKLDYEKVILKQQEVIYLRKKRFVISDNMFGL